MAGLQSWLSQRPGSALQLVLLWGRQRDGFHEAETLKFEPQAFSPIFRRQHFKLLTCRGLPQLMQTMPQ